MATPLGHSIVGYGLARAAGLKSRGAFALAMGAACLPDVDFLAGYVQNGDLRSLHHEVITHKPIFPLLVGAATGAAIAGFSLLRGRRPKMREVARPAALASLLVGSHVVMDLLPLPYDTMPASAGYPVQIAATQAWNAVIDLAAYGLLASLVMERNGHSANA